MRAREIQRPSGVSGVASHAGATGQSHVLVHAKRRSDRFPYDDVIVHCHNWNWTGRVGEFGWK